MPTKELTKVAQVNDLYLCSCGEKFPTKEALGRHMLGKNRWADKRGEEKHRSMGHVDPETGEITMPPASERTREQKARSRYSPAATGKVENQITSNLDVAAELRLITRSYTIDYSTIMRLGRAAAYKLWRWPLSMPLGDFLDTVIYRYFKEHGVTLEGFFIEESPEEKAEREAQILALEESLAKEEVDGNGSKA
jgi:hypothetical protein